jgi:uncharacterized protein YcnI
VTIASRVFVFVLGLVACGAARAHVTVWPRESNAGGFEKYVVRVPTEGKVATASIELRIPEGLTVASIGVPQGFRYELKKSGERTTTIIWTQRIEPGEFAEFTFMARNPAGEGSVAWNAVQTFVDGSTTQWTGPPGDRHPASLTVLKTAKQGPPESPGEAQHHH